MPFRRGSENEMQNANVQPETVWTATEDRAWDATIVLASARLANPNTQLSSKDLQDWLRDTFRTLQALCDPIVGSKPDSRSVVPLTRLEIERSIGAGTLISFENGRHYKNLKRHLTAHDLTPDQYREKWRLPEDYPMVHPSYSEARSRIAKEQGLGRKAGGSAAKGLRSRRNPE